MELNTSNGDSLEIENNEYLKFKSNNEEYKVSLKKIGYIGDFLLEDAKKYTTLRNIALLAVLIFLFLGIKLINDPYLAWEGTRFEEVSRIPDSIVWTFFACSIIGVLVFNSKIQKIKLIDFSKKDYELRIRVTVNDVPNKGDIRNMYYVICKGSIQELKEIKSKLETIKNKSLLI